MLKSALFGIGTFTLLAAAGPSLAQDTTSKPWDVRASFYTWFPKTETGITTKWGEASSVLSAKAALKALEFASMALVEARNGDWSVVGDVLYMDIDLGTALPMATRFDQVDTDVKLTSVSAYGLYNVYQNGKTRLDAGAGVRAMRVTINSTISGPSVPDVTIPIKDDWADPVIALRAAAVLNDDVSAMLWLDYGGIDRDGGSKETWNVVAIANWRASEKWRLSAGYRALAVDREDRGVPYDIRMSGPLLSATFSF